ncbi:hypothetical protein QN277_025387 [Acacia crassicarpa]|uniref:NAC domain-containing protein n=1 Tax=Acacia crassicarpa TaxID=499986 RepID=A0AAE1J901_9FABA|nr:hypothetical protein QN277_025387 [Acacia crassicarpa]
MENISVLFNKEEGQIYSSIGFRFQPTDEELLTHFLYKKTNNANFSHIAITEVVIQEFEAWDLPWLAKMGDYEWYFFCQRISRNQDGSKANRATEDGYWKSTGNDANINDREGNLIGKKKTLVFYMGGPPTGVKTDYVMHEYRLAGDSSKPGENEWVICRVFEKTSERQKTHLYDLLRF